MKRNILIFFTVLLLVSCTKERAKSRLIEYEIGEQTYSFEGFAIRYTDYVNDESKGYDWHIYNEEQDRLYIQAYDSTFTRTTFAFPSFQAVLDVELPKGLSKTYKATTGEFRITGLDMGDVVGDFRLKMKNMLDPEDSLMITNGYFRIYLEHYSRVFTK
jgi:hypothetical protein